MLPFESTPQVAPRLTKEPEGTPGHFYRLRLADFHSPAGFIRLNQAGCRQLRIVGHQAEALLHTPLPGEDEVQRAKGADLEPPGIDKAVSRRALRFCKDQGRGAVPPKEMLPIAARFELPALLIQTAIALRVEAKWNP